MIRRQMSTLLVWISSDGEKRKCDREDKERKNNLTKQISLQKYEKNLKRILNYIREFIEECKKKMNRLKNLTSVQWV